MSENLAEQLAVEAFENKVMAEAVKKYGEKGNYSVAELTAIRKELKGKK